MKEDEIKTIFDDDVQVLVNWIASDPKKNSDKFIQVCNLINDDVLPVRCVIQSYDDYLYFYPINEEMHCMCIVRPGGCGEPEELFAEWSQPDNYDLPTLFARHSFIDKLRELNLLSIESLERSLKLKEILG